MRLPTAVVVVALSLTAAAAPCSAARYDALAIAAQAGDAAEVAALLDTGANPNDYDKTYSALMYAAGNGHAEVTRLLLARGAWVDHRDHNGDRALLWASQRGHVAVVRLLIAARAAVESDADPYRITPLMQACRYAHLAVARVLLAAGADPRRRDHVDDTALHGAALSGNPELVAMLLQAGADPSPKGKYLDSTPLHLAVEYGRDAVVQWLLRAGAAIEARDHKGRTPLWVAASLDRPALVEILLAAGAEPDARDESGRTPFVSASGRSGATARLLVEHTRDIDRGFAAALWGGHADLGLRLVERGADINAVDDFGQPGLASIIQHQGTGLLELSIKKRQASRAYRPAEHLTAELGQMQSSHAAVKALLAR